MNARDIMEISPIVPVIALEDEKDALPLAKALQKGGVNIMEITLRTPAGLKAIEIVSKELPSMNVGAGTVCNEEDLIKAKKAGAKFVFSPGISQELINASKKEEITLIPGVATASEVMLAQNNNIFYCKLFPATLSGGVEILKAFAGPFPKMNFCPTGGVNLNNLNDFLILKNVLCVGGTWFVPKDEIIINNFEEITSLCKEAINSIKV
ncbi:bifunctional 4-hydroxy-2-oxoglutarate aldolase/2-dehydro-3-deoxy-phosphogluconate aldolase [Halarcobacter ebronensis]|uniref:2-dehydro-3-deoxy-phosphogluconate aldolase n=1 Tax=Halarcobacter ebronensis TaxID=1462615 RepID=A0A4Q1AMF7_9BACT|nr:bifunctional 4-hydroxy-2-oxoglutarate aldolase/2-dehydro-3-deoxy-phosphogluconate aldolase [Halarcobacter ebronensis]QKF82856.1 multifunctional 2-keto-3-deoxygluconate 6-phosphate aldolase and 2-keto-4-hydroxyglutarate aldolase and oxaloacetate decarboxylase [Halarcobacter ebronensis]RXK06876.1 keto-deoxy-phosphogluconate aldolase [Halarcobacter ebronensis]